VLRCQQSIPPISLTLGGSPKCSGCHTPTALAPISIATARCQGPSLISAKVDARCGCVQKYPSGQQRRAASMIEKRDDMRVMPERAEASPRRIGWSLRIRVDLNR